MNATGRISVTVISLIALSAAQESGAKGKRLGMAGTYRVSFCQLRCSDTFAADVRGYIVLSDAPISLASLPPRIRRRVELQFQEVRRSDRPNACFTLVAKPRTKSVAGAEPVGFTSWVGDDSSADLSLFRAPDSGYDLSLELSQDSVRGVGHFYSGNGPGAQLLIDSVIGRRVGPPDVARCLRAALSAR